MGQRKTQFTLSFLSLSFVTWRRKRKKKEKEIPWICLQKEGENLMIVESGSSGDTKNPLTTTTRSTGDYGYVTMAWLTTLRCNI